MIDFFGVERHRRSAMVTLEKHKGTGGGDY